MIKKTDKEINLYSFFENNQQIIYSLLIYAAGVILGSVIFKTADSTPLKALIEKALSIKVNDFTSLFFNRLGLYFSVFSATVLLGMCLIGYPLIWLVPAFTGFIIAFKVTYYYLNFEVKGIGYSLLMVIPEGAALTTILIFTIINASELSRLIFRETLKNKDMTREINLKSYLKKFLLYSGLIVIIALINALIIYLINSLIIL